MSSNYGKILEKAAKQMILVHRLDTLVKLIIRTIIVNLKVNHAGILLYDKQRDEYVAQNFRGESTAKVPTGLVKVKKDNSLIRYFTDKNLKLCGDDFLSAENINKFIKSKACQKSKKLKTFFENVSFQFSLYNAKVCIPGFFRNELICILFIGQKKDHKRIGNDEIGFLSVLSSDVVMAIKNTWFFEDLKDQLQKNRKLFLQTVMALATAVEAKDKYTLGHTERVSSYSLILAKELKVTKKNTLKDWDKFFEDLRIASFLHDIGKIGVPEKVLNKEGPLDDSEYKEMKRHPLIGFSILKQVDEFREPIEGVRYHHERYDGGGYPWGLKGEQIPLIAQIIAVVDTFDAMTTDRPYRKGMDKDKVASIIAQEKGKQFSPLAVDIFLHVYKKGNI